MYIFCHGPTFDLLIHIRSNIDKKCQHSKFDLLLIVFVWQYGAEDRFMIRKTAPTYIASQNQWCYNIVKENLDRKTVQVIWMLNVMLTGKQKTLMWSKCEYKKWTFN